MALPNIYRNSGEGAIASYDFQDIASGSGVEAFYGAVAPSGTTFLTDQLIYSDIVILGDGYTNVAASEGAATVFLDKDFDITFNLPRAIKGKVVVEIPHGWRDTAAQSNETLQKVVAYLRKVDLAGNEINLVSMTGGTWRASSQTPTTAETKTTLTTVSGEVGLTTFKKGEKLRLTLNEYTWDESGGNPHIIFFGTDPQGRLTNSKATISTATLTFASGDITTLRVLVPFRIDL